MNLSQSILLFPYKPEQLGIYEFGEDLDTQWEKLLTEIKFK